MRLSRATAVVLLALFGLVLAAAVTYAASTIVSQPIGLASEPTDIGESLAPPQAIQTTTTTVPRTIIRTTTVQVPVPAPQAQTTFTPSTTPGTATTQGTTTSSPPTGDDDHGRRDGDD